ncbi:hypothetical protein [uncultured Flavobacterium sp.]|uniref:hypothetical protein n=1 Tax=uncultured Flavobacterium sp. TaxID=165435 RepID=UPI0030EE6B30|tara:strand:- start:1245 stop:1439 length:195 start_codon:yes stop_codon:yes gene_type:complete
MKTKSTSKNQGNNKIVLLFISTLGLSYGLVRYFVYDKLSKEFLLIMSLLFVVAIASFFRNKYTK